MQRNSQQEIVQIFRQYPYFIISSHIHLDGDALGSV